MRYVLPALVVVALGAPAAAHESVRALVLPAGQPSLRVTSMATERRLAINGSRLLRLRGMVSPQFLVLLAAAYDRLRERAPGAPSALLASQLNLEHPRAFDTLVVPATNASYPRPRGAVVFLHGYAGNIGLMCWTFAQAASQQGLSTYCPSLGFEGDWWSARGAATLRATLNYLNRNGTHRIYLAGLSNGATGASLLARRFRRRLAGLLLISGLARRAQPPGVRLLLLHGRTDPAVKQKAAQRYLAAAGRQATHRILPGNHFVMLTHEAQVQAAISSWLKRQLPACYPHR